MKKSNIYLGLVVVLAALQGCESPDAGELEFRAGDPCAQYEDEIASTSFKKVSVITDLAVVNDNCRAAWNPSGWALDKTCTPEMQGHWSFWYLASQMAGKGDPSRLILKFLETFEEQPIVNGQELRARPTIWKQVINPWRAASGCSEGKTWAEEPCELDASKTPLRLLGIVNRIDIGLDSGFYGSSTGEGRFVFGFVDKFGAPLKATVILEYALSPKYTRSKWAELWLSLDELQGDQYRKKLQLITDGFVMQGVSPGKPNSGSALRTVRTNELSFAPENTLVMSQPWVFREFRFGCTVDPCPLAEMDKQLLVPSAVALTPADAFNETTYLKNYLYENYAKILANKQDVPLIYQGKNFRAGESTSFLAKPTVWGLELLLSGQLNGLPQPAMARHKFGLGTCNGCHYAETENKNNHHIAPRAAGSEAKLSGFLAESPWVLQGIMGDEDEIVMDEPHRRLCALYRARDGISSPQMVMIAAPH